MPKQPLRYNAVLRNASPDDMADILSFLETVSGVLPRPAEDFRRAVETGFFYMVELEGAIVAVAGVFFLNEHGEGPLELGSCFVSPSVRGFGLQRLLVLPRIAAAIAFFDEDAFLYTAIKSDNAPSIRSMTSMGFEPTAKHEPLLFEPCLACHSKPDAAACRSCCCDFFILRQDYKCSRIRELLANSTVTLRRKADSYEMKISIEIQLLRISEYRSALQDFINSIKCLKLKSER